MRASDPIASEPVTPSNKRRQISTAVVALMLIMIVTQIAGFVYTARQQDALIALRSDTRGMRIVQQAIVDTVDIAELFVLTGDEHHLEGYHHATQVLREQRGTSLAILDDLASPAAVAGGSRPALQASDDLARIAAQAIDMSRAGRGEQAKALLIQDARARLRQVRASVSRYLDLQNARGDAYENNIAFGSTVVMWLQILGGALTLSGLFFAFRLSAREAEGRQQAMNEALEAHGRIKGLLQMTDMLQSAVGYADANAVLRAAAGRLLPGMGGALYVFNNSRDHLELSVTWDLADGSIPARIAPASCWALKRGKPHINHQGGGASLYCDHHRQDLALLELPMMAGGEVYGLLCIAPPENDVSTLRVVWEIAVALADAMSLTLSNIALREKLRDQALRDPLTSLYNRRYMEDMLERLGHLSERSERPLAAIMIDLDHFKRLNDEHGHAKGDAVLRATAAAITGELRQSDVACRYGGEELIVLLPDCSLADAAGKAEMLRAAIEQLSIVHGTAVTASLGVAAIPQTVSRVEDLVAAADTALYDAKENGRNRVRVAPLRNVPDKPLSIAAE